MKKLLLLSSLTLVTALAVIPSEAAPPVAQPVTPKVGPATRPDIKKAAKLEVKNAAAVPGETRNVEATLTVPNGATGYAGKSIAFRLQNRSGGPPVSITMGNATTNAQGKATLAWKVPEIAQAGYDLKASFAGDDDTFAASSEGNFAIIKAMTKFEVSYNWGALDSHGGPQFGTLLVWLRRQSDNDVVSKTFHFTVNGQSHDYTAQSGNAVTILLPTNTTTWNTKLVFDGDPAYQATMAEKTYNH